MCSFYYLTKNDEHRNIQQTQLGEYDMGKLVMIHHECRNATFQNCCTTFFYKTTENTKMGTFNFDKKCLTQIKKNKTDQNFFNLGNKTSKNNMYHETAYTCKCVKMHKTKLQKPTVLNAAGGAMNQFAAWIYPCFSPWLVCMTAERLRSKLKILNVINLTECLVYIGSKNFSLVQQQQLL